MVLTAHIKKNSIYFVVTSKCSVLLHVELKLFIKLYFLLFNSTAVSLGKPPRDKPNPQTWYRHRKAHSAIYIVKKKDTQSTVEQSFKMMRIMVMTGVSQDCPRSLRFQKTGKKARYKKMFEEEMKR